MRLVISVLKVVKFNRFASFCAIVFVFTFLHVTKMVLSVIDQHYTIKFDVKL